MYGFVLEERSTTGARMMAPLATPPLHLPRRPDVLKKDPRPRGRAGRRAAMAAHYMLLRRSSALLPYQDPVVLPVAGIVALRNADGAVRCSCPRVFAKVSDVGIMA